MPEQCQKISTGGTECGSSEIESVAQQSQLGLNHIEDEIEGANCPTESNLPLYNCTVQYRGNTYS